MFHRELILLKKAHMYRKLPDNFGSLGFGLVAISYQNTGFSEGTWGT